MHAETTGHHAFHKIRHNVQQREKKKKKKRQPRTLERQKRSRDQKNLQQERFI